MRKVLLSVMTVGFLLAFNACKKGDQGPAGPAGPTGAQGAQGIVGPQGTPGVNGTNGTNGADGAKFFANDGVPSATTAPTAKDGDFYFDRTAKALYGPRTAGAWGTATVLAGANGAAGATGATGATGGSGAAGTKIISGVVSPVVTAPTGANVGDFYFDKTTGIFYGPYDGTPASWTTNEMPLGSAYAAKTWTLTKGFDVVNENPGARINAQKLEAPTYSSPTINASAATIIINDEDLYRISKYPGWGTNREMIFESAPNSNVFNAVPVGADGVSAGHIGVAPFIAGAKFRYSHNTTNPLEEFTLTTADIARLTVNGGTAFGYLTYAKAVATTFAKDDRLVFYANKAVKVVEDPTKFYTTYKAVTTFDLTTLVGVNLEKYKQDGKVFVKYKYYNNAGNLVVHTSDNAGWIDLSVWANSFVKGGYDNNAGTNPFSLAGTAYQNSTFFGSAGYFAQNAVTFNFSTASASSATAVAGPVATPTAYSHGKVYINWDITSGSNTIPAKVEKLGPIQLSNPGSVPNPVLVANTTPSATTALYVDRPFATGYYSTLPINPTLIVTDAAGTTIPTPLDQVTLRQHNGGVSADKIKETKLVQVQIFVVPGDVIKPAKEAGVNVNSVAELSKYISLNK